MSEASLPPPKPLETVSPRETWVTMAWAARVPGDLKLVLLAMALLADDAGQVVGPIAEVRDLTGFSGRAIRGALVRLEMLEQLHRVETTQGMVYRIHPR